MSPREAWQVTFGEFWPLYNSIIGRVVKPMSSSELDELESAWAGGRLGNA